MISNFCTFNGVRTGVMWICGWYARFVFGRVAWIRIRIRAFFAQRDPDPSKLTDPYGSGSVPRIRRIFMKTTIFFLFFSFPWPGWPTKGEDDFGRSVIHFSAPHFLRNYGILVKHRPILWKLKILLHNYT